MIELASHVSGDTLYFYANTHRFDTGVATDADAAPSYRIYIQENGTAVATGTMALLDSVNTAGFYSEAVALTAYDPGEYVCYISATVNSVVGTKSFPFTVGQGAGPVLVRTTIATLASQTSFTLTAGPAENNALLGAMVIVRDAVSIDQLCVGLISAYTGATRTVTLGVDPGIFTMAIGDFVEVIACPKQLPAVVAEAAGGLYTRGTGAGQINQPANGLIDVNVERWNATAVPAEDTAGYPVVTIKDGTGVGEINTNAGKVVGVELVDTLTTYTGNTPQTGDAFLRLGVPAGASVSADILVIDNLVDDLELRLGTPSNLGTGATVAANLVDIEAQTDDIGAAGAGLTAVPWNAAWDAEAQSEVQDALEANNLDHIAGTATGIPAIPAGTYLDQIMDDGTATFDRTTDSLQALRDRGDAAWTSGGALVSGTADSGSTTTMVDAARTEPDVDYWRGNTVVFTNGSLNGQCRLITGFNPVTDTFTFAPATTVAVATHTYDIVVGARVDVQSTRGIHIQLEGSPVAM